MMTAWVFPQSKPHHALFHRAASQRRAAWHAAVPARGRADADLRHHGSGQPGARLALYARRLFRRDVCRADRKFRARRRPGAGRDVRLRRGARSDRDPAALRPQPPRSRARHVWAIALLQRTGAARLGPGRHDAVAAQRDADRGTDHSRRVLSGLPAGHHRRHPGGRGAALHPGDAHAARHADPRRRVEPRNGRRARRQHKAALHFGVRARRGAGGLRRPDAGADSDGADRHGREHFDPRLRGHHHRRHWLDPRRLCRRHHRRADRHHRPRFPARFAARSAEHQCRADFGAGAVVDVDLHADGRHFGVSSGRTLSGGEQMSALFELNPRNAITIGLLVILALIPLYATLTGNSFVMTLFTRVLILAMAAVSLNLIMGYGGMVSFGHAAYLGLGGYAVGILAKEGIGSGFIQWPMAIAVSALFALVVGALSLRTRGVYFIMITLAFAQMVYYVAIGLDRYGGDDGLTIYKRSQFGVIDLNNKTLFYYLCLALLLVASIYLVSRMVNSRFGLAIQGARSNERRMRAIGFPVFRYKLTCFVIAGALCGLAGALLANHTNFISPATMFWTRSGDLMVLVVLGGLGTPFGPMIGTVSYLLLEEALSRIAQIPGLRIAEYHGLFIGPVLLLVAIYLRGGIESLFAGWRQEKAP